MEELHMDTMKTIVLAAGKGSRLQSEQHILPKVLRKANGKALLDYVLDAIRFVPEEDTIIVVGYKSHLIREHVEGSYHLVEQAEQLGTGHAVKMTEPALRGYEGPVLIVYGDMPLYSQETYRKLIAVYEEHDVSCALLTAKLSSPLSYGRILRDEHGRIRDIREVKDCTEEELEIDELNSGVYVFDSAKLFSVLDRLKNDNLQGEYYLTDVPRLLLEAGEDIASYTLVESDEVYGVNTPEDLLMIEELLKRRES